ncbi:hypothetical protein ABIE50_005228 [Chitinophaga sp. OAE865]
MDDDHLCLIFVLLCSASCSTSMLRLLTGIKSILTAVIAVPYPHNFNLLKEKYLPDIISRDIISYAFPDQYGYLYIPSFSDGLTLADIDITLEKQVHVQAPPGQIPGSQE